MNTQKKLVELEIERKKIEIKRIEIEIEALQEQLNYSSTSTST